MHFSKSFTPTPARTAPAMPRCASTMRRAGSRSPARISPRSTRSPRPLSRRCRCRSAHSHSASAPRAPTFAHDSSEPRCMVFPSNDRDHRIPGLRTGRAAIVPAAQPSVAGGVVWASSHCRRPWCGCYRRLPRSPHERCSHPRRQAPGRRSHRQRTTKSRPRRRSVRCQPRSKARRCGLLANE